MWWGEASFEWWLYEVLSTKLNNGLKFVSLILFLFFNFFAAQKNQLKRYWSGWREYDRMKKRERNHTAEAEQFAARLIKRWAVAYSTVTN